MSMKNKVIVTIEGKVSKGKSSTINAIMHCIREASFKNKRAHAGITTKITPTN